MAAWQSCVYGNQSSCGGAEGSTCAGAGPTPPDSLLTTPGGPAFPAPFRVYPGHSSTLLLPSSPTSSLSANPVGSTFKRYSKSNHFSQPPLSLLRSKPRSPLIWMTAGASELVVLLPPFSLNLLLCSKPSGVLRFFPI